mmetsp:Transcript_28253/g.40368  ORF Transcript_28253/g.40368 Transcript_28253/m.40368 type:complete len:355 (+) Transcript_28253:1235-2299(+)
MNPPGTFSGLPVGLKTSLPNTSEQNSSMYSSFTPSFRVTSGSKFLTKAYTSAISISTKISSKSSAFAIMLNFSSSSPSYKRFSSMSFSTTAVAFEPSSMPTDLAIISLICCGNLSNPSIASSRLSSLRTGSCSFCICFNTSSGELVSGLLNISLSSGCLESVFFSIICGLSFRIKDWVSVRISERISECLLDCSPLMDEIFFSSFSIFDRVSVRSIFCASSRVFFASACNLSVSESGAISSLVSSSNCNGCASPSSASVISSFFLIFCKALAKNGIRPSASSSLFDEDSTSILMNLTLDLGCIVAEHFDIGGCTQASVLLMLINATASTNIVTSAESSRCRQEYDRLHIIFQAK